MHVLEVITLARKVVPPAQERTVNTALELVVIPLKNLQSRKQRFALQSNNSRQFTVRQTVRINRVPPLTREVVAILKNALVPITMIEAMNVLALMGNTPTEMKIIPMVTIELMTTNKAHTPPEKVIKASDVLMT